MSIVFELLLDAALELLLLLPQAANTIAATPASRHPMIVLLVNLIGLLLPSGSGTEPGNPQANAADGRINRCHGVPNGTSIEARSGRWGHPVAGRGSPGPGQRRQPRPERPVLHGLLRPLVYETTNFATFIESGNERNQLARRGHAKGGRHDLRLVGVALCVALDGNLPLVHETYEGNRNDATEFLQALEVIRRRLGDLGLSEDQLREPTLDEVHL